MKHNRRLNYRIIKSLKKLKISKIRRGISPIIATLLLFAMVTASVVIGFLQILPYMEQTRVETGAAQIQGSLIRVDENIWSMISDSGIYLPGSFPTQQISLNLPIGALETNVLSNQISYQPVFCNTGSNCTTFDTFDPTYHTGSLGTLHHQFTSTFDLIPERSLEYLTGSSPNEIRDIVAFAAIGATTTTELTSTNLTLSRIANLHSIELSYRPKVFMTQTIDNNRPTYQVGLSLINITGTGVFAGASTLKLIYKGATVTQTILMEDDPNTLANDVFELLIDVGGQTTSVATIDLFQDGLFVVYKLTTVIYNFEIST